nr:microfibril-associated glycoprotein 4-like [Pocillopora verrucosa]
MTTIAFIVSIMFGTFFSWCSCFLDNEFRNIVFKEPIPNKKIKKHLIKTEDVPNEGSCRVLCYMDPDCVSINLGPFIQGKHICQLNNATDKSLAYEKGFTHLAIENHCDSGPCLNGGTCQAGFTSKGFRCICPEEFSGGEVCQVFRNCAEIFKSGEKRDGVYFIKPDIQSPFDVFCDQTTAGGGWTVFQKRIDGSADFDRHWSDYKHGFGNLNGEFWLGLDRIHRLTLDNNSMLRVDMEDFEGESAYAEYSLFGVRSEHDKYQLILGSYNTAGTAGDSFSYHHGCPFTTPLEDNDFNPTENCARNYHGGWWFKWCHKAFLNGPYIRGPNSYYGEGVIWEGFKDYHYSLKSSQMKIRPRDF